jgi:hypothetical protein
MHKAQRLLAGLSLALFACGTGQAIAGPAEKAQAKVERAQESVAKVRSQTADWGLWKSTLKILGNAEVSLEQGDYQAAREAAERVISQAEQGQKQYREEKQEWSQAVQDATRNGNLDEASWTAGKG